MPLRQRQEVQALPRERSGDRLSDPLSAFAAVAFYTGSAALVVAAIRGVRAAVERKRRDPGAFVLGALGVVLLVVALVGYLRGGRSVVPF